MFTPITSRFSKAVVATVVAGALSLGVVAAAPASASTTYEPERPSAAWVDRGVVGLSASPVSQPVGFRVSDRLPQTQTTMFAMSSIAFFR